MSTTLHDSTLVASKYGSNHSYLTIAPKTGGGIEVRPTNGHGQSLNRFWPVWLRELVVNKMDVRHTAAVELFDRDRDRVTITASHISTMGLTYSVASIAAEIRPLIDPPLKRSKDPRREFGAAKVAEWAIKTHYLDALDWSEVLADCNWPGVKLWCDLESSPSWCRQRPAGTIRMTYTRQHRSHPRLWVVAAQLELTCALAAVRQ